MELVKTGVIAVAQIAVLFTSNGDAFNVEVALNIMIDEHLKEGGIKVDRCC